MNHDNCIIQLLGQKENLSLHEFSDLYGNKHYTFNQDIFLFLLYIMHLSTSSLSILINIKSLAIFIFQYVCGYHSWLDYESLNSFYCYRGYK